MRKSCVSAANRLRTLASRPTRALLRAVTPPESAVEWVQRVNNRWLVQADLRQNAAAFLDHLAATDPGRLQRACRLARDLTLRHGDASDPKPWFYGSLFRLATPAERARYLRDHPFLRAIFNGSDTLPADLKSIRPDTRSKLAELRATLARP